MTGISNNINGVNGVLTGLVNPLLDNNKIKTVFENPPEQKREIKIKDLISLAIIKHKITNYSQKITYVSIGVFDWFDLFKEEFSSLDPTLCMSIECNSVEILPNLSSYRNITLHLDNGSSINSIMFLTGICGVASGNLSIKQI